MAKSAGGVALDVAMGRPGSARTQEFVEGLIKAPIVPIQNIYEGIREGDYDKVAYGAGGFASQTVPVAAGVAKLASKAVPSVGDLRAQASKFNIPEKLQVRAEANKVPLGRQPWQERALIMGPSSAVGYAVGGPVGAATAATAAEALALIRRSNWYRGMKAGVQESVAQKLDIRKTPIGNAEIPTESRPWNRNLATVPAARSATSAAAAEEAARIMRATAENPTERTPFSPVIPVQSLTPLGRADRMNIKRPGVPEHITKDLEARRAEMDASPLELETKPPEFHGEPVPFEGVGEAGAVQPNWKSIEQAIAPVRNKESVATFTSSGEPTVFGRRIAQIVPELKKAYSKESGRAALEKGIRQVTQTLNEVEDAIDGTTVTVDKTPIVEGLSEIQSDLVAKNLMEDAEAVERLSEEWLNKPDYIPWDDFRRMKGSFYQRFNMAEQWALQFYGLLIDAVRRVSPELANANSDYSIVRRATDAARINIKETYRRTDTIGKTTKSSSVPIAERATPAKTVTPSEPQ